MKAIFKCPCCAKFIEIDAAIVVQASKSEFTKEEF